MDCLLQSTTGKIYGVQPNYELGNLRNLIPVWHHKKEDVVKSWLNQLWGIGAQLRHVHVIHRDIRPSNICVTIDKHQWILKLIDWKTAVRGSRKRIPGNFSMLREDLVYQPPEVALDVLNAVEQHS